MGSTGFFAIQVMQVKMILTVIRVDLPALELENSISKNS